MSGNIKTGAALVVAGVVANNYIYLHDLIVHNYYGTINLGPKSYIAIAISLAVIAYGLYRLACPGGAAKT